MPKQYTEYDRQKAVAHYLVTGNIAATAKAINIPRETVQGWKKQEWFIQKLDAERIEQQQALDASFTENINLAQGEIKDRIIKGDFILNKNNELIRKPMGGKDLSIVSAVQFDKRQISRNLPTSINTNMDNEALNKLQRQFQALSRQSPVIEGEVLVVDEGD